jgi:hypothetical protein
LPLVDLCYSPLVEGFSDHLFWDCDRASLDPATHAGFLVGRVLMHGTLRDWRALKALLGKQQIKAEVIKLPYLDARTLGFCATYFQIPVDRFRCFTKNRPSSPTPASC